MLDIDGDGKSAFSDGVLLLGFWTNSNGDLVPPAPRATAESIGAYVDFVRKLRLLDADRNGNVDPFYDGSLIVRYLAGLRGADLFGEPPSGSSHTPSLSQVETYLKAIHEFGVLDVDGNGRSEFADGMLIFRVLIGLPSSLLLEGILPSGPRQSLASIERYLQQLRGLGLLDVTGDGNSDNYLDGTLILRYMVGLRGSDLFRELFRNYPHPRSEIGIESYLQALTQSGALDVDGDGVSGFTDAVLAAQYLLGRIDGLIAPIVPVRPRSEAEILKYIDYIKYSGFLDADGSGRVEPWDHTIIQRYFAGLRGSELIAPPVPSIPFARSVAGMEEYLRALTAAGVFDCNGDGATDELDGQLLSVKFFN